VAGATPLGSGRTIRYLDAVSGPDRLEVGYALDRRWHRLRGEMEESKREALEVLTEVLEAAGVPYAVIGGLAVQLYQSEPRTTLDIDVAVLDRAGLPVKDLRRRGFECLGHHTHSDNWRAPDGTPVQFTDDPELHAAVRASEHVAAGGIRFRVIRLADLLRAKLRAAADPARRRSKRLLDLADVHGFLEEAPELAEHLTAQEREQLERLPS
jgi:predicted nucleotidyltransferase